MADDIYRKIGKETGKDVRIVRAAAHHPFEFLSKVMADPSDHKPVRFRYFGVFHVKPYWRKGLRRSSKVGSPIEGDIIWAKVPEEKFGKIYYNLKFGCIKKGLFKAEDNSVTCPIQEIQFWVKQPGSEI
jgi:hypothetical protein